MPRMTNTYMLGGDCEPEEIIKSVKNGVYAVNFSGGQVDIVSGKFVFAASEAYLIEDGKIKNPVTDNTEVNLDQASYYVDLLDMLQTKARGNMSEYEEQMLINAVSELKMEFIQKKKIEDSENKNSSNGEEE